MPRKYSQEFRNRAVGLVFDRFRDDPGRVSEVLCMRFNPQSRRRVRNNDCCVPEETWWR